MKLTLILEVDDSVTVSVTRDGIGVDGRTLHGAARSAADEISDRACELGFIND